MTSNNTMPDIATSPMPPEPGLAAEPALSPRFATKTQTVTVRNLTFQLSMIADLDAALDHYVTTSPTDTDMIPYFSRLWESAKALAEYLADHPQLCLGQDVLEFGCGLGLPSMTAAKLGAHSVTATDYHPDNEPYLLRNAALNHISTITYHRLDWRHPDLTGSFPLAFGSDLIYDKDMVPALVDCVDRFTAANATFILADPGRAALQHTANMLQERRFHLDIKATDTIFLLIFTR
ncbi:MAG: ribosomal protein L11 methyltransferase [Lentisphaerae bacterium ADurb.Bin082]|nr:MAG: ribosomal protein L11 methyltransferase [Lentisphaerae bacterium ADurb.Bin082]